MATAIETESRGILQEIVDCSSGQEELIESHFGLEIQLIAYTDEACSWKAIDPSLVAPVPDGDLATASGEDLIGGPGVTVSWDETMLSMDLVGTQEVSRNGRAGHLIRNQYSDDDVRAGLEGCDGIFEISFSGGFEPSTSVPSDEEALLFLEQLVDRSC